MSHATSPAAAAEPPAAAPIPVGRIALMCVAGAVVGLAGGLGASTFVWVEHELSALLWDDLPEALGHPEAPWWLAIALLAAGGLVVHAATRLPGHGGHSPLDGFGLDIGPREVGSVILAALGSLSFGAVLGPEAPLMAIGTALGAVAIRARDNPGRQVLMLAGAMAAIGAIFGNPLISAFLLLEMALVSGRRDLASPIVLLPALAALASGYTLQVGLEDWSGLGEAALGLPGLPSYPEVLLVDLLVALPLAVVVAIVAIAARIGGEEINRLAHRAPLATILAGGVVVALCAIAVDAITGGGLDLVLFSGQSAMTEYLALTGLSTALVVLVGKVIAYSVSLGVGFRGGAIFPAVAAGALLATACSLVVDGTSVAALAAVAIAAATTGALRTPFLGALLAVLLTDPAGAATTVLAVLGAIVGLLTRMAAEQRMPRLRPHPHDA